MAPPMIQSSSISRGSGTFWAIPAGERKMPEPIVIPTTSATELHSPRVRGSLLCMSPNLSTLVRYATGMDPARNEHHVKPIAWVWAAGIVAASIGGAVFVTQWKPMTRSSAGVPIASAPRPGKRFVLPLDRPNLPVPLNHDPANPQAALYDGVSRLLGGDDAGAVDSLTAAARLSTGRPEQEARWYLAIALERTGRVADAVQVLEGLCREEGSSSRSCAGL